MDILSNKKNINSTMPPCTVIPVLGYVDVSKAIEWLCNNFGFKERWRVGNHRAQLLVGNGAVVIREQEQAPANYSPRHSLLIRVDNIDSHCEYAKQKGVTILQSPADYPYGERQYTAIDLGGHEWTFSQSIADLEPEDWGGTSAGA